LVDPAFGEGTECTFHGLERHRFVDELSECLFVDDAHG